MTASTSGSAEANVRLSARERDGQRSRRGDLALSEGLGEVDERRGQTALVDLSDRTVRIRPELWNGQLKPYA